MKKLALTFALLVVSTSVLAAQPSINLAAEQQITAAAVKKLVLKEGASVTNYWFEVPASQLEGSTHAKITGCALSTDVNLTNGKLNVITKQMRCINEAGDIFTKANFKANLKSTTSQLCTSNKGGCVEVTLYANSSYSFAINEPTKLVAELNLMREVNRARLMED